MRFVSYNGGAPDWYKCRSCGTQGVKLWRLYQTFSVKPKLLCCHCAAKDQGKDIEGIDADGCYQNKSKHSKVTFHTDQIGWLVPAVPTEEGPAYWGYSSVPEAGVEWWRRLPTSKSPGETYENPLTEILRKAMKL